MELKKISDLTELDSQLADGDYLPILDVSDLTQGIRGSTRKITAKKALYTPATKVIAPLSSGIRADFYTDGIHDDEQIQLALDAVNSLGGGMVKLMEGSIFNITSYLKIYSKTILFAYGTTINLTASATTMIRDAYHAGLAGSVDHITIKGGIWNGGSYITQRIFLVGGASLDVRDIEFSSSTGNFALNVHNSTDFHIENIFLNNVFSDGVHISGPAARGVIKNIHGTSGDDMVAILPNEYTPYTISGDVTDIEVDGVFPNGNARANVVRILGGTSGATVYNTKRIKVKNISGTMTTGYQGGIWIGDDTGNANTSNGQLDDITIDNISLVLPDTNNPIVRIHGSSNSLNIPNVKINNITIASDLHSFLYLDQAKVTNLIINNVSGVTVTTSWIGGIFNQSTITDIKNLILNNISVVNAGSKASQLLNNFGSVNTHVRNIQLSNIYLDNFAELMDTASGNNLYLSNIRLKNNNQVFNIRSGGAVIVYACNGLFADSLDTTITSTGTLKIKSLNFPIDILDAQLIATKGDMAYNINVAAPIGIGPTSFDGAAWVAII